MSQVRLLVGTRKGAFVLTSDGKREKWDVSGPHFAGWEIYHMKGSPVDPDRMYASQSSGWFGQVIQRSNDGGKTWEPVGNKFAYDGVPGTHQWYDGTPHPVGVQAGVASGAFADECGRGVCGGGGCGAVPVDGWRAELGGAVGVAQAWFGAAVAAGRGRDVSAYDHAGPERSESGFILRFLRRGRSGPMMAGRRGSRSTRGCGRSIIPDPDAEVGHCVHHIAMHPSRPGTLFMQKHWDVMRSDNAGDLWTEVSGNLPTDFGFVIDVHAHEPETIFVVPIKSDSEHFPMDGKLRVYRSKSGGNEWEAMTKGLPQKDCYVNVLRDAMAVDTTGCVRRLFWDDGRTGVWIVGRGR